MKKFLYIIVFLFAVSAYCGTTTFYFSEGYTYMELNEAGKTTYTKDVISKDTIVAMDKVFGIGDKIFIWELTEYKPDTQIRSWYGPGFQIDYREKTKTLVVAIFNFVTGKTMYGSVYRIESIGEMDNERP